ncbi:MAG: hypothetical protein V3R99_14210, partial [Thermoguttaceae bacterium]
MLKTTARIVAVAMGLSAGIALAGPLQGTTELLVAAIGVSQAQTPPTDRRATADDLLRRAQQAIAEDNLDGAETLITQAEALEVQYSFRGLFANTPEKVRRELERKRSGTGTFPTLPSRIVSPKLLGGEAPRTDPFAIRPIHAPSAAKGTAGVAPVGASQASLMGERNGHFDRRMDGGGPFAATAMPGMAPSGSLPHLDNPVRQTGSSGATSPFGRAIVSTPPAVNDVRALGNVGPAPGRPATVYGPLPYRNPNVSQNTGSFASTAGSGRPLGPARYTPSSVGMGNPLLLARRALAEGDLDRAFHFVQRAKQQPAGHGLLGDTPENVEAAIAEFRKYENLTANEKATESYRRGRARLLMDQADALLRLGDYDLAEELATSASRLQASYGPTETKPRDMIERIRMARRSGDQSALRPLSVTNGSAMRGMPAPSMAAKQKVVELCRQAEEAIRAGQLRLAEDLAHQAERYQVPDSAFAPGEPRPGLVLLDIRRAGQRNPSGVISAGGQSATSPTGPGPYDRRATRALYDSSNDPTRNLHASLQQPGSTAGSVNMAVRRTQFTQGSPGMISPSPVPRLAPISPGVNAGPRALFQQGEAALKAHDPERAYQLFVQAEAGKDQLDPDTWDRLQGYLQLLSAPHGTAAAPGTPDSMIDQTAAAQTALARQVSADVAIQESRARTQRETDPQGALTLLETTRNQVEAAGLEPVARGQLLRRVDRALLETRQFIEQNRPRIELTERNDRVRDEIDRAQRVKLENQEKLALMVDEFNKLLDEQRFAEAEVIAKRAEELDPTNPVVVQLNNFARFTRHFAAARELRAAKEAGFMAQLAAVDRAAIGFDSDNPYQFGDVREWEELSAIRGRMFGRDRRRTEREVEIEQKLKVHVSLSFTNAPLREVLDHLGTLAEVNMYLDPLGLAEEAVMIDTPISIEVRNEIMLKSALNLILEPLHLDYVIKDEVLKITSEALTAGEVYQMTYNVADLIVPIPNFVPTTRMGLSGALHNAMREVGFGGGASFGGMGLSAMPPLAGSQNDATLNASVMAQISPRGMGGSGSNMPMGFGPGGLGGGSQADFDPIITLITETIQPRSWLEAGGEGTIAEFETNLSLVISQTQEVHEEIVDLLEQLRRLQDLQVTIEVRFITLNDNFFERIGVDFDFDINDKTGVDVAGLQLGGGGGGAGDDDDDDAIDPRTIFGPGTMSVGMQSPGVFSADLDIPFTQNNFQLAVPQFGGFDAAAGAQLGFAILSDIEAFFFINAAEGDRRSNVLQAPKVTLFNGQQASVMDQSDSPFVMSVIPVVSDFAAAQQPVIVVLSEGTSLTVQAVVSNDRRFVRLTVVPFFSKIGEVNTFQFTGSESTTEDTTAGGIQDDPNDQSSNSASRTTNRSGTTVQLPTLSYVTVSTTVSVPDGGTVLLGGIKRLSEGRN